MPLSPPIGTPIRIKVAIIDSGVHPDHPHITASALQAGFAVTSDGQISESGHIPLDRLGHGTAVCAAVQEKAPDATIMPVQVFHESLRASALALVCAMDEAVARGAQILNLSLGTTNMAHAPLFAASLRRAAAQGVLVIAASQTADGTPCLPAALADSCPNLLGVDLDWDVPRHTYRWHTHQHAHGGNSARLVASGYPRPIEGVPLRRNLYGISFAVAQATGFAARAACSLAGNLASPSAADWPATICAQLAAQTNA